MRTSKHTLLAVAAAAGLIGLVGGGVALASDPATPEPPAPVEQQIDLPEVEPAQGGQPEPPGQPLPMCPPGVDDDFFGEDTCADDFDDRYERDDLDDRHERGDDLDDRYERDDDLDDGPEDDLDDDDDADDVNDD
jgi:hypothetical protein